MSDHPDIAASTQRFRDAVRSFTPAPPKRFAKLNPLKEGIVELREKGASLRLIRELLATVDVAVSVDTIARFLAEVTGAKLNSRSAKHAGQKRRPVRRGNHEQTEPAAASAEQASPPQIAAPTERHRTRGPRVADPQNL